MKYLLIIMALGTGLKADMVILATGNRLLGTILEHDSTKVILACQMLHPEVPPRKVTVAAGSVIRVVRDLKKGKFKLIKTLRLPPSGQDHK